MPGCGFKNDSGKLKPADIRAARIVVQAVAVGLLRQAAGNVQQGGGKVSGIGGCAVLVADDAQAVALCAQAEHGFDEIAAVFAEYPRSADDNRARAQALNGLFAGQFAFAVYASGANGIVFGVGLLFAAVEYIVCGNVNQGGAAGFGGFGQISRTVAVDGKRPFTVAFGFIDGGIGRRIDDNVGAEV